MPRGGGSGPVRNPFKEEPTPGWAKTATAAAAGFAAACALSSWRASWASSPTGEVGLLLDLLPPDPMLRPENFGLGKAARLSDLEEEARIDSDYGGIEEEFPKLAQAEFFGWVSEFFQELEFEAEGYHPLTQTKTILDESLWMGCDNIVANQKDAGNFNYLYDFVKKEHVAEEDFAPRQAMALWGIALCFQSRPSEDAYRTAVERGIEFFGRNSVDGPVPGSRAITYPGDDESAAGTNALYGLALVDYLRTIRDNDLPEGGGGGGGGRPAIRDVEAKLDATLKFLRHIQRVDLSFAEVYSFDEESEGKSGESKPYFDGEALLCLVKAAKYIDGHADALVPLIEATAPVIAMRYTLEAWREDEYDSEATEGFYQWASMAFEEYYFSGWKDADAFGTLALVLAHWILYIHEWGRSNAGFAYEGLISALRVAQDQEDVDDEVLTRLRSAIGMGLDELGRWQVGGPLSSDNEFLAKNPADEKVAIGGVMNAWDESVLRIDTTHHQMNAFRMAIETLFADK